MTDATEDRARETAHEFAKLYGCSFEGHGNFCDRLTAAIRQYGDKRAAEEREACAKESEEAEYDCYGLCAKAIRARGASE